MNAMTVTNTGLMRQEFYETASHHAGKRARLLRRLGYDVSVDPAGMQVTPVGVVKSTLVTIYPGRHRDTFGVPKVGKTW
jgi:hypothetical protein